MYMRTKITKEILLELVPKCTTMVQVLRLLDCSVHNGSSHAHLTRQVKKFGIDTSHFTQKGRRGTSCLRKNASDILVLREPGSYRQKAILLRRALLETGRPLRCYRCWRTDWLGEPLVLDIDHVNGLIYDDREENLRFACPNCHSQTPTFKALSRRKPPRNFSDEYQKRKEEHAAYRARKRIERAAVDPNYKPGTVRYRTSWPLISELTSRISKSSLKAVASELEVSGTAVRNFLKKNGAYKSRAYKRA